MKYRRFGRTELEMPVFSCGGMRYQHKWQDVPEDEIPEENQRNLEATIKRSLEVNATYEGVVLLPVSLAIISTLPLRITATALNVVPKSIPIATILCKKTDITLNIF